MYLNETIKLDIAAQNWQLGFQEAASPIMEAIINFHNYVMSFIVLIVFIVVYFLAFICSDFSSSKRLISHKFLVHGSLVETIWTIIPAFILIFIAFPSFKLIYLMDEVMEPNITLKVIGHQWYWSYEYSDYSVDCSLPTIEIDSYMIPTSDLEASGLRLLETDNHIVIPAFFNVRVIITSADVIHSWAVPALGIKLDAVPGRLNQTSFMASRFGLFYGQCSEICGANHAFMPIVVESVKLDSYYSFINANQNA